MEQSSAADSATVAVRPLSWIREITPYQWRVFLVVWLGWILDSTDFGLFSFVLRPALTELLGDQANLADVGRIGGVLSMVGLLGWAVGGFVFGVLADYVGRVRTLAVSIVLFSIFTGLQGLAHSSLQLGIYRCLAGVGAGAEIVVGIPLLAEALSGQHRAKITGIMMTGSAFGSLLGASAYSLLAPFGWRYVFIAGVVPALLLFLLRRGVAEPAQFTAARERRSAHQPDGRGNLRVGFGIHPLRTGPAVRLRAHPQYDCRPSILSRHAPVDLDESDLAADDSEPATGEARRSRAPAAIADGQPGHDSSGASAASSAMQASALSPTRIGRRGTIVFYNIGTHRHRALSLSSASITTRPYPYLLPVFGFFVFGVFSGHAVYLPELFPTHVRATALSFCNRTGRIITSFGPLVAGLLVAPFGGNFSKAAGVMTCFALLSLLAVAIGRETKEDALPQ